MPIARATAMALAVLVLLSGCSALSQVFLERQHQNLALVEGTRANHPGLIDGDLRTVGRSDRPVIADFAGWRSSPYTQAVVRLPTEHTIARIVVHSDEIESLDLHFEAASSGWVFNGSYAGLKGPRIVLEPAGDISASGVQLRITGTRHTLRYRGRARSIASIVPVLGKTSVRVDIREIEVYGPVGDSTH